MKILYISKFEAAGIQTGREMLSNLIWDALQEIEPKYLFRYNLKKINKGAFQTLAFGLVGWLDGLTDKSAKDIISVIFENSVTHVFIDGSNYGRLAREVKRGLPNVKVVTLFHNVEYLFFRSIFRKLFTVRSFAIMMCNFIAERMAVRWSDTILCLNSRDSEMLGCIYGKYLSRIKIELFPLCIAENPSSSLAFAEPPSEPYFALFVGGAFYANIEGVRWFAQNVAGHINCKTYVVGKGFDAFRKEFEKFKNINVVGAVEDLGEWYKNSAFVISPIFDGSGMKTKTAEAMQFGRPIFGTAEAFIGYEMFIPKCGFLCNDARTFIRLINGYLDNDIKIDSLAIREIYKNNYSTYSAKIRLRNLICS